MAMLPDPASLRCFIAASELPSFRGAARRVGLSPAAFSERIRRLEEGLEAPLFVRTTRSVTLTEAGHRLLPAAHAALEALQACRTAVDDEAQTPPFTLTLGTRYELGLSWLTPALSVLSAERPERQLNLRFGDSPELLRALREGTADAAVTSVRLVEPGLDYAPLHEEDYVFVGAPGLLRDRPLRGREDAPRHVLVDAAPDLPLFRYLLDALPAGDWRFAGVRLLGTIGAVLQRVEAGDGVAVLPLYFVRPALAEGRLERLLPEIPLRSDLFRLVWRHGHPRSVQLRTLGEELCKLPLQ